MHAAGSSGGSAASVAARIAPWALCEDTGGSCRSPAIANGELQHGKAAEIVMGSRLFSICMGCLRHGTWRVWGIYTQYCQPSVLISAGIFGLRPTLGCYNYSDGLLPATFTRDTVGESPSDFCNKCFQIEFLMVSYNLQAIGSDCLGCMRLYACLSLTLRVHAFVAK